MTTAFRRRWRLASSTACSAAALAATGCGGAGEEQAPPPTLPGAVGALFVNETEDVEAALAVEDYTRAREEALDLRRHVLQEIERGRVPDTLQDPLLESVNRLIAAIPDAEPPPPPAEDEPQDDEKEEKDDEDKKDKDDKDKGKGKGDDAVTVTVGGEVTTLEGDGND